MGGEESKGMNHGDGNHEPYEVTFWESIFKTLENVRWKQRV
jgi:hypothetical protein